MVPMCVFESLSGLTRSQRVSQVKVVTVKMCLLYVLESTYRHQASIDDEMVSMEILDTAGQVIIFTFYLVKYSKVLLHT